MILYILSIFLSAFLIFQIQPMIARYILPWFGGTPACGFAGSFQCDLARFSSFLVFADCAPVSMEAGRDGSVSFANSHLVGVKRIGMRQR